MRSLEEIGRGIEGYLSTDEWKTTSQISYESGMLPGAVRYRLRILKLSGRVETKIVKQRINVRVWKLRCKK